MQDSRSLHLSLGVIPLEWPKNSLNVGDRNRGNIRRIESVSLGTREVL
jgi:hypothetical protein